MVSGVNGMKIMNMSGSAKVETNEKEFYFDEKGEPDQKEKQFVMLLADFNEDGRVDTGDR